jgi:hypothetical protein
MFAGLVSWIIGGVLTLLSITGLFMAAKGGTENDYAFGLGLFFLCVIGLAALIRHSWNKAEHP